MQRAAYASACRQRNKHWRRRHSSTLAVVEEREEVGGVLGHHGPTLVNGSGEHIGIRRAA